MKRLLNWWRIEPMSEAHYATFYGIPCWFADIPPDGCTMAGRNQLYDRLLLVFTHLHNYLVAPFYNYGFPVRVGPRVDGAGSEPER